MSDSMIPIISLADVSAAYAPTEVLDALRRAGETVGVIQVIDHGVPQGLIDDFDRRVTALLARPREHKERLASPTGHPYRGWRQWPDDLGRLELERYTVARFDDVDEAVAAGVPSEMAAHQFDHPNAWPDDEPGFRELVIDYRAAINGLAERILGLFALALGVPAERFASVGPDLTSLIYNKYPTWVWPEAATDEDKLLLLEHADSNAITILHQSGDYAGLQVQRPDGSWETVEVVEGALQVFFGGLVTVWTNDHWVAGRHRVIAGGQLQRHSTAAFYSPGFETVVGPIPELLAPGEEVYHDAFSIWDQTRDLVTDYLRVFGRPEQVAAYQQRQPFVADVLEHPTTV